MGEEMKHEMSGLRRDVAYLITLERNTAKVVSRLIGDISEMKRDVATKEDISTLVKSMDSLADALEAKRA